MCYIDGKWYDFTTDNSSDGAGIMIQNRLSDEGDYYLGKDGAMQMNCWCNNSEFGSGDYYYANSYLVIFLSVTLVPDLQEWRYIHTR